MDTDAGNATRTASRPDTLDMEPPSGGEIQRRQPAPPQPARPAQVVRELPAKQQDTTSILAFSDTGIADLFDALSQAQGEFSEVERTLRANVTGKSRASGDAVSYSYDYAPLDEVLQAVRPALSKHGLSLQQFPAVGNGYVIVRTLLGHKGGGWMMNDLRLPCDTGGPQAVGSGITFARRYSAMPILGVAPGYDDDGVAASGPRQGDREPIRQGQRRSQAQGQPAQPAQPQGQPTGQKPPAAAKPDKAPAPPARPAQAVQPAVPMEGSITTPAATPTATTANQPPAGVPAPPDQAAPQPVGRIEVFQEKPNGALLTLDTGFRAASKDADTTRKLKDAHEQKRRVVLSTRPSSDPSKFAPVVTGVVVSDVTREREPGEEG